ncbi:Protein of unknown function [Bacillus mycoides]|nr:Protein of unknown function [Bacillus mycoides]
MSFIFFHITIELFYNTTPNKASTTHARPIHFMYGFSALPPVAGRYVSIFFGVCSSCGFITICCDFSICGMIGLPITFGCSGTCGCGASVCSGFCGCSGCGVSGVGGVDSF